MTALIIIEHHDGQINPLTSYILKAASEVSHDITALVVGYQLEKITEQVKMLPVIQHLVVADNIEYEHQLAENVSKVIAKQAKSYSHIFASSSTFGKDVMPRVAAMLGVEQISDITTVIDSHTFVRPIYAGNAYVEVKSEANPLVITVRASAFDKLTGASHNISVEHIDDVFEASRTTFINKTTTKSERPELTNARVIIAGGRGLQSGENFHLLEKIADKLNAAIGASRAAVDAGFVPNDYQVGQTGKIVAPDLYIAVGISGAIQHLAGMKDSKVIVAINKDPDAPIFGVADYGLVGDLFKILPELDKALG